MEMYEEGDGALSKADALDEQERLARKAASARQARLRHKGAVQELEEQVQQLSQRASLLEAQALANAEAASRQLRDDLRAALPPDQWIQLSSWCACQKAPCRERLLTLQERVRDPPIRSRRGCAG